MFLQMTTAHSVVVMSPQSTAVDYSLRDESPRSRQSSSTVAIDLSEWRNHRVLALRDSRYFPGVIRDASHSEIYVEFDDEGNKLVRYNDLLGARKYDVIADSAPITEQVTLDAKVCARIPCPQNNFHYHHQAFAFYKGTVCTLLTKPKRYVVKILRKDDQYEKHTVKRCDLRLIRPPWWDELEEEMEDSDSSRTEANGELVLGHPGVVRFRAAAFLGE